MIPKEQQIDFLDHVEQSLIERDYIKSLKKDRLMLIKELVIIGESLLKINQEFKFCKLDFDNVLANNLTNNNLAFEQIEGLSSLGEKYKKLSKLFKKHYKKLVEIELEIISLKTNSQKVVS